MAENWDMPREVLMAGQREQSLGSLMVHEMAFWRAENLAVLKAVELVSPRAVAKAATRAYETAIE